MIFEAARCLARPVHCREETAITDRANPLRARKAALRGRAYLVRDRQPDREALSARICDRVSALPEYAAAETVMWYVGIRSEVRTAPFVKAALGRGPRIAVPFCDGDALGLWRLERFDELEPGTWGILEPPRRRWREPDRRVPVEAVDLVVVPGVAFDVNGARLGNGKGYYDRLLPLLRPDCLCAGVAYESQLAPRIPMGPGDVFLDRVVTEGAVYRGRGRG